ncbi:MAG: isoprenylcysteine carboxylmethyltransferase family protein [Planctomycetaceae bacterium]|jgi:protein-S-isoprenylcysteine O-methyltransferase Ste14|nr:isoprenylcysteine carboxylmethyltransferase family protein [Planctomycetaceae bacterium]
MPPPPRFLEILAGLSVLASALFSLDEWTPQRGLVAAVQIAVGGLLLLRRPLRQAATPRQILACLPALLVGAAGLALAGPPDEWGFPETVLFGVGTTITLTSFLVLGRSFGVLPAARNPVTSGPYRCVRHPAYVGQLLMLTACGFSGSMLVGLAVPTFVIPLLVLRIRAEEQLLNNWADYRDYTRRVRWRICPLVW